MYGLAARGHRRRNPIVYFPALSGYRGLLALQQVQTHSGHEWLGGGRAKPGPDATRRAAGVGGLVLAGIASQVRCTGCDGWKKN
jgi:hypothetical protein